MAHDDQQRDRRPRAASSGPSSSSGQPAASSSSSGSSAASGGRRSDRNEPMDVRSADDDDDDDAIENEENIHERLNRHQHQHNHHRRHHRRDHRQPATTRGHKKELIKPDPTVRAQVRHSESRVVHSPGRQASIKLASSPLGVATVVDEEQLHQRLVESKSERPQQPSVEGRLASDVPAAHASPAGHSESRRSSPRSGPARCPSADQVSAAREAQPSSSRSTSSSSSSARARSSGVHSETEKSLRSPPPAAIIIPPNVARSLSMRSSRSQTGGRSSGALVDPPGCITREQLAYGPLLKTGEVQVLYRSPEADTSYLDRHLKEGQAKQVAPNLRQSPIAIMSMNPTYELQDKPIRLEYPATVENLRLNNTGFCWEVKIPYQISMTTGLYGAHLSGGQRYRLDQFHCHWGASDGQGSEHTVDSRSYSAEIHFVHYNMDKYHTLSKAARHPDGLVVLSVFVDAQDQQHNHAELEKIVSQLKSVPLKGEHSIIRQAVRIENLLPANRSYWSYQGSLTTPPYFESVTWFILKQPIKCSRVQLEKFRGLKASLRHEGATYIRSNHRKTQPLNGRTIVNYDEPSQSSSSSRPSH